MRKKHNQPRCMPFCAGLVSGYGATLALSALMALALSFTNIAAEGAVITAMAATALGSLICGRTAGKMRGRGGLKTGALCGIIYFLPLMIISLITGSVQGVMLPIKALICVAFSTVGGVAGVNSEK